MPSRGDPLPPVNRPALTLWRLSDDKPGHDKQSQGLAAALARLTDIRQQDIHLPQPGTGLAAWLRGRFEPGRYLPPPDLILGAGHRTHLPLLAARRAYGGRTVVLMKPSLPLALFDLCLIPAHDRPPIRANVVSTKGALNTVVPSNAHDMSRGLILVGGPSRHFHWDNAGVAEQIRAIVAQETNIGWNLTTSRRTPADFLSGLAGLEGVSILSHDQTPSGWLEAELAASGRVWVTPDSVSMVYEALTAGCATGLLDLAPDPNSRVARGVTELLAEGYVTALADWQARQGLPLPREPLREADRCAQWIRERWF